MSRIDRLWAVALAAFAVLWVLLEVAFAGHSDLLHLAPMALLLLPLLHGRYLGEERLIRALSGVRTRRRTRRIVIAAGGRHGVVALARGGALLASGVARRPPPLLLPA